VAGLVTVAYLDIPAFQDQVVIQVTVVPDYQATQALVDYQVGVASQD
jgi:hypothetical protein